MAQKVKASEFKAKCLALLDRVEKSGEKLVVTKNGRPVADLVPHQPDKQSDGLLGLYRGRMEILGDIISPIDVEWEAMK